MTNEEFLAMLTRHEGKRRTVYKDSRGYWTIGVGFLVDPKVAGSGLTDEEISAVLAIRVGSIVAQLDKRIPWWRSLTPNRQAVLTDMAFNLGVDGLLGFKNTLNFIKLGNYNQAAHGMLQSLWAKQVGNRAVELSDMMKKG